MESAKIVSTEALELQELNPILIPRQCATVTNMCRLPLMEKIIHCNHKLPSPLYAGLYVLTLLGIVLTGCEERIPEPERMKIAHAYADVLFIQAKFPADSLHRMKASDSVVQTYGYTGWSDLKLSLDRAALNPDDFRIILDSAQRIIERRQRPAVLPSYNKPSSQTKASTHEGADAFSAIIRDYPYFSSSTIV